MTDGPLDDYRAKPGGGPACIICGHRFIRHADSYHCLQAALAAISAALVEQDDISIGPERDVH